MGLITFWFLLTGCTCHLRFLSELLSLKKNRTHHFVALVSLVRYLLVPKVAVFFSPTDSVHILQLQRRHEQMKKNLEAQHKELEEKRRQFEDEKANWEAQQRILEQQNSSR